MSIITKSDFVGELTLATLSQPATSENLTVFINKYETKFLKALLGSDFVTLFTTELATEGNPPVGRMANLLAEFRTAIASYIYYWYLRDQDSQVVGVGTVKTVAQNATLYSSREKVKRAWFEMVQLCWCTLRFLNDNASTYPEFVMPCWWNAFNDQWLLWNYGDGIFGDGFFYWFYRFYRIPDIFIPINTVGI